MIDLKHATDDEIRAFYALDRDDPKHVAGRKRKPLFREFAVAAAVSQLDCETVLDVGCGDGHLAGLLTLHVDAVTVMDAVVGCVEEACRRVREIDPFECVEGRVGLVEDLTVVKGFDAVTCCETIEHVRDPRRAVANLARAARRLVVITTPVGRCYDDPSHIHHWNDGQALVEALDARSHFSEALIHEIPSRLGDEGLVFMLLGIPK